ncbi:MAG: type III secretion system inner membrane ring subunit SctD [Desulfovibrionaceae bacterium]|nr:type III secretion system inner membrane ring subunit SctD [Desulfovibrionaceae bacterium]
MTEAALVLHIFSGVHLGAKLELPLGTWLLGSDDSCDLILQGLSPQHAKLYIEQVDSSLSVAIEPVGGVITLDGQKLNAKTELPKSTACYLDQTCVVWNLPGVIQDPILPQSPNEKAKEAIKETQEDAEEAAEEKPSEEVKEEETEKVTEQDHDEAKDANQPIELPKTEEKPRKSLWQRLKSPLPLLFLAILLGALSFALTPKIQDYPSLVEEQIKTTGLSGLLVTSKFPGVEIKGAVPKEADLDRLREAVENLAFPVYLEVLVDADMLRAVNYALRIRGFAPLASMERTNNEVYVKIKAFMRDTLVEADAKNSLETDVPSPPQKKWHILHEEDVAPTITKTLAQAGFSDIKPVYLPGMVTLTGPITTEGHVFLLRLQAGLSAHFGVPLFGESEITGGKITSPSLIAAQVKSQHLTLVPSTASENSNYAQDTTSNVDPLAGLTITALYSTPLNFIVSSDGRCLFKGATLPSGFVIENIATDGLTLRRGNKVLTYKLRGNNE